MSVINMNTATMEELMKIKDIGETKSKLIIKAH
jgi:DNA uptake protein ComE-like DNA-binding protein